MRCLVTYAEEGAVDMAELEELSNVFPCLVASGLAAVAEHGEAADGEAQQGLQHGHLPRTPPPQQNVQLPSHLLFPLLTSPTLFFYHVSSSSASHYIYGVAVGRFT